MAGANHGKNWIATWILRINKWHVSKVPSSQIICILIYRKCCPWTSTEEFQKGQVGGCSITKDNWYFKSIVAKCFKAQQKKFLEDVRIHGAWNREVRPNHVVPWGQVPPQYTHQPSRVDAKRPAILLGPNGIDTICDCSPRCTVICTVKKAKMKPSLVLTTPDRG